MPNNMNAPNPFPAPIGLDGFQIISGTCSELDAVNCFNGNLTKQVSVVSVHTVGLPLELTLYYNTQDPVNGILGNRWRCNLMQQLLFVGAPPTQVTYIAASGRQFGFLPDGAGGWKQDGVSAFFAATLANPGGGSTWTLTFPDGTSYSFDGSNNGRLTGLADNHGNATTVTWSAGTPSVPTIVTEPTGRSIVLGYNPGNTLMTSITDPNGTGVTMLAYTAGNLSSVVGPQGCTLTYGWDASNRIITRQDANSHTYTYGYTPSGDRLNLVKDAETPAHQISYQYNLGVNGVQEPTGGDAGQNTTFNQTLLTDARGFVWDYRFEQQSGTLWRVIDPYSTQTNYLHYSHFAFDPQQKLTYASWGLQAGSIGPKDNLLNVFNRWAYDNLGNMLYAQNGAGEVTQRTYDAHRNLTSAYPAQGNFSVQGNWVGQYGADGSVLCAFNNATSTGDQQSLPSYVPANGVALQSPGVRLNPGTNVGDLYDPRTPVAPDSPRRARGYWQASNASFQVRVSLTQAQSFNLSVYTASTDAGLGSTLQYPEQFGRDITLTVNDLNPTAQSYRVYNNAMGVWVTFPCKGDANNPVVLTVAPSAGSANTDARISALAFDPIDNHRTTFGYTAQNDVNRITDGLGNQTQLNYSQTDGTLQSFVDARNMTTSFFYEDVYKNLTRIQDAMAAAGQTRFTFDKNGNVLSFQDGNGSLWKMAYDLQNRLTSVVDPFGQTVALQWDPAGNLTQYTDENGNSTQFSYTNENRLSVVTDANLKTVQLFYDKSGNLIQIIDQLSRSTLFTWDNAEHLTQVLLPDGTSKLTAAYDAQDRLAAVTTPNGNAAPAAINVTRASNFVQNPGAETPSPYVADGSQAQFWTPGAAHPSNIRDTAVAHLGQASLRLATGDNNWVQNEVAMPRGVTGATAFWARGDGTTNTIQVQSNVNIQNASGGSNGTLGPLTTLPATTAWTPVPLSTFSIPGDASFYNYYYVRNFYLLAQASGSHTVWFDDAALYSLSTAFTWDGEYRLVLVQQPDGAQVMLARDRYGRVAKVVDPRGKIWLLAYDALDRIVGLSDPLGNRVAIQYDAVSNPVRVTDANLNYVRYAFDNDERLSTITYMDNTTEVFTFDLAGNLLTYTNNRLQQRTFLYDRAERLVVVNYGATRVGFSYDAAGRVVARLERSGDMTFLSYDKLNRLAGVEKVATAGSPALSFILQNVYDAAGNRIECDLGLTGALYDTAGNVYDNASTLYETAAGSPLWTVPGGYDLLNRMPKYNDSHGNQTVFSFDVESHITAISYPNSTAAALAYDIVGKLLSLVVSKGASTLLSLAYDYDLAGNRTAMTLSNALGTPGAVNDTTEYDLDDAGRLVGEHLNRVVERTAGRFAQGAVAGLAVDAGGTVGLLAFNDSFAGTVLQADRWRLAFASGTYVGMQVAQNNGLQLVFPRGYADYASVQTGAALPPFGAANTWAGAEHRMQLPTGAFDVQVDYADYQGDGNTVSLGLRVSDTPLEQSMAANTNWASIVRNSNGNYRAQAYSGGSSVLDSTTATTDRSGKFRITRDATGLLQLFWWSGTAWTQQGSNVTGWTTVPLYLSLLLTTNNFVACGTFRNLTLNQPTSNYPASGTYTSTVYDSGRTATAWNSVFWAALTPTGTSVKFQVAVANSATGPWSYVGPLGIGGPTDYFVTPGQAFATPPTGRFARYQATFAGGAATPTLSRVDLLYSAPGSNPSTEYQYVYDFAGSITSKTVEVTSGGSTTTTTVNLRQ